MTDWSRWKKFPDPTQKGILHAPFGPGVYELRDAKSKNKILRGKGKNCAYRMSSLLPKPDGQGTRKNSKKREYVEKHINQIEYRFCACNSDAEAKNLEKQLNKNKPCMFPT